MRASDKEEVPQEQPLPGTRPNRRYPVDTAESSVFRPERPEEDLHPHACTDGPVFLAYTVFDEEIGDQVERLEAVPCRRCTDSK
jgi:hypothetical protein